MVPLRLVLPLAVLAAALSGCSLGGGDDDPGDAPTRIPPQIGRPADAEDAAADLGFPAFATKNTTRVGGADPVADAAGVAQAVFPARSRSSRPPAVALVDVGDWRAAISAAQLMSPPLRVPLLFSEGEELPEATEGALDALDPLGSEEADGAQVVRIGATAAIEEREAADLEGRDPAALAAAIDRFHAAAAGEPSDAVIIAPSDRPGFAMPAAGLSARSGAPVLWAGRNSIPAPTRAALEDREQPSIYVLAPAEAISDRVLEQLGRLGAVERVSGPDPVRHAIAVARYADGRFGWNLVDPGHGLVFANAERTADAAAAAPLSASGTYGPLLLVSDAATLSGPLEGYLLDIQPGYDRDPVRGVYNHGWLLGDEDAISVDAQARIDELLEIQPVRAPGS